MQQQSEKPSTVKNASTGNNQQQKLPDTLAKRIEAERERLRLQEQRERTIYEAICALSDPVDELQMLNNLPVLDLPGWAEVIEERFLGRLCGFPTCSNGLNVDFLRKYTVHRRGKHKEFIPLNSEPNKFCSLCCMCMARSVASQLESTAEECQLATAIQQMAIAPRQKQQRQFHLAKTEEEWRKFLTKEEKETASTSTAIKHNENVLTEDEKGSTTKVAANNSKQQCYMEAELVKSLFQLKVADNVNEEEKEMDEEADASSDSEMEEREFERTIKASPAATTITIIPMPMAKKKEPEVEEGKASTSTKERENPKVANADAEPWRKGFLLRANNETVHRKPLAEMEEQDQREQILRQQRQQQKLLGDVVERIHQKWGDANSIVGQQQAKRNDAKPKVGKKKPIELVEAEPVNVNRVHETI